LNELKRMKLVGSMFSDNENNLDFDENDDED
jgi:hypothetical protein